MSKVKRSRGKRNQISTDEQAQQPQVQKSAFQGVKDFVNKHKTKFIIGGVAAGVGLAGWYLHKRNREAALRLEAQRSLTDLYVNDLNASKLKLAQKDNEFNQKLDQIKQQQYQENENLKKKLQESKKASENLLQLSVTQAKMIDENKELFKKAQGEREQLTQANVQLKSQIEKIGRDIKSTAEDKERLKYQNDIMANELDNLKAKLEKKFQGVDEYEKVNGELMMRINRYENEINTLQNALVMYQDNEGAKQRIQDQLRETESKLYEAEKDYTRRTKSLTDQVKNLESELNNSTRQISVHKEEIEEQKNAVRRIAEQNTSLKADVNEKASKIAQVQNKLDEKIGLMAQTQTNIRSAVQMVGDMKNELSSLKQTVLAEKEKMISEMNTAVGKAIQFREKQYKDAVDRVKLADVQVAQKERLLNDLNIKYASDVMNIKKRAEENLRDSLNEQKRVYDMHLTEKANTILKMKEANEEYSRLKESERIILDGEINKAKAALEIQASKIQEISSTLEDEVRRRQDISKMYSEATEGNRKLKESFENDKAALINKFNNDLKNINKTIEENELLKKQISEFGERNYSLTRDQQGHINQLSQANSELETIKKKYLEKEADVFNLRNTITGLQHKANSDYEKYKQLSKQLEEIDDQRVKFKEAYQRQAEINEETIAKFNEKLDERLYDVRSDLEKKVTEITSEADRLKNAYVNQRDSLMKVITRRELRDKQRVFGSRIRRQINFIKNAPIKGDRVSQLFGKISQM